MTIQDKDLVSIQEVRDLIGHAKKAQKELANMSQQQIDTICEAIAKAGYDNRVKLAKMAHEETGFGIWQDKVVKNAFGSKGVFEAIKDMKTVGVLSDDEQTKVMEIGRAHV